MLDREPRSRPRPLHRLRASLFAVLSLVVMGAGCGDESGTKAGEEGGRCRAVDHGDGPCQDGLTCASDRCVSLGAGQTDGPLSGSVSESMSESMSGDPSSAQESESGPSNGEETGVEATGGYDETGGDEMGSTGNSPPDSNGNSGPGGSDADSCPLSQGQIQCNAVCSAQVTGCRAGCDIPTGCAGFELEDCLFNCEFWVESSRIPPSVHSSLACAQSSAGACDAWGDCLLNADCG